LVRYDAGRLLTDPLSYCKIWDGPRKLKGKTMTNMNPDYIKYETGYCNCRDTLVNNLVHKYVPLGSIISTEQGVIRDRGISRRDRNNSFTSGKRVTLKETMRVEWVIYIRQLRQKQYIESAPIETLRVA
jgi:hypothetical protein